MTTTKLTTIEFARHMSALRGQPIKDALRIRHAWALQFEALNKAVHENYPDAGVVFGTGLTVDDLKPPSGLPCLWGREPNYVAVDEDREQEAYVAAWMPLGLWAEMERGLGAVYRERLHLTFDFAQYESILQGMQMLEPAERAIEVASMRGLIVGRGQKRTPFEVILPAGSELPGPAFYGHAVWGDSGGPAVTIAKDGGTQTTLRYDYVNAEGYKTGAFAVEIG